MVYLEGRLRENTADSRSEHTGYVLEVELEMSAIPNAGELADRQIAITGDVELLDYPDRGKILIFRATSAGEIEEEEEVEGAG